MKGAIKSGGCPCVRVRGVWDTRESGQTAMQGHGECAWEKWDLVAWRGISTVRRDSEHRACRGPRTRQPAQRRESREKEERVQALTCVGATRESWRVPLLAMAGFQVSAWAGDREEEAGPERGMHAWRLHPPRSSAQVRMTCKYRPSTTDSTTTTP